MSVLGSVRDRDAVTSVEHLGAVSEFDLKLTFEQSPVLEGEDLVTNSVHRRGPRSRSEVKSVFHIRTIRECLTVSA